VATTVADADVLVHADVSVFARELRKKIAGIVDSILAAVDVHADTDEAEDDVKNLKRRIESGKPAKIDVEVDTTGALIEVERLKRRIDKTEHIQVKADVDKDSRRGILSTFIQLGNTAASFFTKSLVSGLSSLKEVGQRVFTSVASAGALLIIALPLISAAVVGLIKVFLALLPLAAAIPGFLLAAGGAAAVAFLAFRNLTEAISGDAEAMRKLPPAAREVVSVLRSFLPVFNEIQQSVQQKLFTGLAGPIQQLANAVLPGLRTALDSIATSINTGIVASLNVLNSAAGQSKLNQIFGSTAKTVDSLVTTTLPALTNAFLSVAAAGAKIAEKIAPKIAGKITEIADRITKFAESGGLERAFDRAVEFAKDLLLTLRLIGEIIKEIGGGILSGFTALFPGKSSEEQFGSLIKSLQILRDLLKEPIVQEALKGIGIALVVIAAAIVAAALAFGLLVIAIVKTVQFFLQLTTAIGTFITGTISLFTGFITTIINFFVTLTTTIGTHINTIVGFFAALPARIIAVISALVSIVAGIFSNVFNTARSIVASGINAIVSFLASLPGRAAGAVSAIIGILANIFNSAMNAARNAVSAGINAIVGLARGIGGRIQGAVGNLGGLLVGAGKAVIQGLINGMKSMFGSLASAASKVAGIVRDHLPFSPAKKGPLSGKGAPEKSGEAIGRNLAAGLETSTPTAGKAAFGTAEAIEAAFQSIVRDLLSSGGGTGTGMRIPGFGDGGLVTRPTLAMVGEKGPEMIIPTQKPAASAASSSTVNRTLSPTINVTSAAADPEVVANRILRRLVAVGA